MTESPIESPGVKPQRRKKEFATVDRLPPHSPEAEQGVLGCVMLEPMHCIGLCDEAFHGRDVFYDHRHKEIFKAAKYLCDNEHGFDLMMLRQHLSERNLLEAIGGMDYLLSIEKEATSAANLSYHLKSVIEKHEMRKIIQTCTEVIGRVYEFTGDLTQLKDEVQQYLGEVFEGEQDAQKCQWFSISELDNFDLQNDKDNLVGNRYLTRGSSLIVNGASGRGKSSLLMLRIILWALGRPFYGQKVVRPLTAVIWQTENNCGDLAKAFQGALNFLGIDAFSPEFELLEKNIRFAYCPGLCGKEFLRFAMNYLLKNPTDLACLDPFVSFPEGDLNGAMGAGEFLRKGLNPISFITSVTWIINHHTPKPLREQKPNAPQKKVSDYQYSGAGSFDIPGWARAVETLEEAQDGVFRLWLAKRGAEAGACHPNGEPTQMLWLKHATNGGIHWEQIDPPEQPEEQPKGESKGGQPNKVKQLLSLGLGSVIDALIEPIGKNDLARRIEAFAESKSMDVSIATAKRAIEELVKNNAIKKQNGCYVK